MISGINGYDRSSYLYNISGENLRIQNKPEEVKADSTDAQAGAVSSNVTADSEQTLNKAPTKSNPESFMDDFRGRRELNIFEGTSRYNEMEHAEQALAEMKKDDILDRYKYFVNPSNLGTDADGTVRIKNN